MRDDAIDDMVMTMIVPRVENHGMYSTAIIILNHTQTLGPVELVVAWFSTYDARVGLLSPTRICRNPISSD